MENRKKSGIVEIVNKGFGGGKKGTYSFG